MTQKTHFFLALFFCFLFLYSVCRSLYIDKQQDYKYYNKKGRIYISPLLVVMYGYYIFCYSTYNTNPFRYSPSG